jgi:hypothetical protein
MNTGGVFNEWLSNSPQLDRGYCDCFGNSFLSNRMLGSRAFGGTRQQPAFGLDATG